MSSALGAAALAATPCAAQTGSGLRPSAIYLEGGLADSRSQSATIGVTWDWAWMHPMGDGAWGGYWDLAYGAWHADPHDGDGSRWYHRIGFTPVLRYTHGPWFAEAGIGLNLISPHYRRGSETFSTDFNFGDHLGLGLRFGPEHRNELALRYEHFSNADIEQPNPGEDFVQLRFAHRF